MAGAVANPGKDTAPKVRMAPPRAMRYVGRMPSRATTILLVLASLVAAAGVAAAPPPTGTPTTVLSDAELTARLAFLEERLDAGRPTALAWEWGWTGFYTAAFGRNLAGRDRGGRRRRPGARDRRRRQVGRSRPSRRRRCCAILWPPASARRPCATSPGMTESARLQRLAVGETAAGDGARNGPRPATACGGTCSASAPTCSAGRRS